MSAVRCRHLLGVLLTALIVSTAGPVAVPSVAEAGPPVLTTAVPHGQSVTLDGGALRIRPTAAIPTVRLRRARFDLNHSNAGGVDFVAGRVYYGAVTVAARRTVDPDTPGRYPVFRSTPAWVLFFNPGPTGCAAARVSPQRVAVSASSAMVINARTGAALIYVRPGAGTCVKAHRPSVRKAAEKLSVPWTVADVPAGTPVTAVTAQYPGCSAAFSVGGISAPGTASLLGVEVVRAFGPCHAAGRSVAVSIGGLHLVAPLRHEPVGPITTGQSAF